MSDARYALQFFSLYRIVLCKNLHALFKLGESVGSQSGTGTCLMFCGGASTDILLYIAQIVN